MLIYALYLEIQFMWHLQEKKKKKRKIKMNYFGNQSFDKEKMSKERTFYFERNV